MSDKKEEDEDISELRKVLGLYFWVLFGIGSVWFAIAKYGFNENSEDGMIGGLLLLPAIAISTVTSFMIFSSARRKVQSSRYFYYIAGALPILFAIFALIFTSN